MEINGFPGVPWEQLLEISMCVGIRQRVMTLTNVRQKAKAVTQALREVGDRVETPPHAFLFILRISLWHIRGLFGAGRGWCQYTVSHTWQPSKFNWADSALLMRDLSTGFSHYQRARVHAWRSLTEWAPRQPHSSPPTQSLTRITSEEQLDAQDQQQ